MSVAPPHTRATTETAPSSPAGGDKPMSHREVLEAMTGLMAALFTAMLSSTIVSTALPTILADLKGTQSQYTWIITASLLATTVSTPIWGKLSDLASKKVLVQLSIVVFVLGSVVAGMAHNVPLLIGARVLQGLGMGGLTALTQSIMGAIVSPRERGRYGGYMGAVMAVSTVSGPLLGGLIVDTPWLGWRWTFYLCIPLAVIALVLLQKTLHLTTVKRRVQFDYLGAVLIAGGASLPLLWVTFAGHDFAWLSWQTAAYLGASLVLLAAATVVELRHPEPLVPLRVLGNRTAVLVIIASISVGTAMFGGSVFLTQYLQVARGYSPTEAGLLTIPVMLGSFVAATVAGQIITRTGTWKVFLVIGGVLLTAGLGGLGTLDHTTPIWRASVFMGLMGLGMGCLMQNLMLAVQNTVDVTQIGATSATVSFFRTLGGAVGVSVLGAILATRIKDGIAEGLAAMGVKAGGGSAGASLDISALPKPIATLVRSTYADATGHIFVIAAVISLVALVAVVFIKEVPLRTSVHLGEAQEAATAPAVAAPDLGEPAEVELRTVAKEAAEATEATEATEAEESVEWETARA
ncbi:drug resistance transporter, EmrB/QacA subfamily [Pedococcus cremeus]|uniref:Drug resistance transporter, EmrB/QacA subfamily n=1 Tax=Pedococcus cremeus TaxID=587636 RepID=A0A1H9WGC4_9MICO|nr:MDR family MFS transporter [Pedococcus cremeus]SES32992.1 drug resistance transporter, EmrB/QacA subfamily [Pedococcus cremeus]